MNKPAFYALGLVFTLAACGGGGGGVSAPPPTPTPVPIANTALTTYLPMANGNSWTFASGGKFTDLGSGTLTCTCSYSGGIMERIALYSPGSTTVSGSFFFTKNTPSGKTQLTNLIGVENDSGTSNISVMANTAFPDGLPIMDDAPAANESWNDGLGDVSTITSIGGTLFLANGSKVIDIATDQITGGTSTITFSLARGVGFTGIGVGTQSTTITSFYVNAASSTSSGRVPAVSQAFKGRYGRADANALLQHVFR